MADIGLITSYKKSDQYHTVYYTHLFQFIYFKGTISMFLPQLN